MKVVRAQNLNEFDIKKEITPEFFECEKDEKISLLDALMQQTINENKIKVEITLTKRQYDLWIKKGGEKWLKKVLIGQQNKRSKK